MSANSAKNSVSFSDIGPVEQFKFELPPEGGLIVFRGPNGAGKSRLLDAAEALMSGNGKHVEHSDGASVGVVEGFGATLRITKSARRTGEPDVEILHGKFDLADLVEPGLKSADARCAKRITALVSLATRGQAADVSKFYRVLGSEQEFRDLVSAKSMTETDTVALQGKIKRDIEGKARELQDEAEKAKARAESDRLAGEGLDLTIEDNAEVLQDRLEVAIEDSSALRTQAKNAQEALRRREEARSQLAQAEASYTGLSVEQAEEEWHLAQAKREDAAAEVRKAEEALRAAKERLVEASHDEQSAQKALDAAVQREQLVERWRNVLASDEVEIIPQSQIDAAQKDVDDARAAQQAGMVVRNAKERVAKAQAHLQRAADLETEATRLREAAKATEDVLSEMVGSLGVPLEVHHGRLTTPTDRGPRELFDDLSKGEQCALAVKIAKTIIAQNKGEAFGAITLAQDFYEGLDPEHKEQLAKDFEGSGIWCFTAHNDSGDLRAEAA